MARHDSDGRGRTKIPTSAANGAAEIGPNTLPRPDFTRPARTTAVTKDESKTK
jgi:hypothetical protein